VTVAVATTVLAVVLQTLVTYWLPAVGVAHGLQVVAPPALYVLPPTHATEPPWVPTAPPPAQAEPATHVAGTFSAPAAM
jgi:hypothetical protein